MQITLNISDKNINIEKLDKMPTLSDSTTYVFKELGVDFSKINTINYDLKRLKGKTTSFANLVEEYNHEKKHETRNKILHKIGCLIRAALIPAIVAGLILTLPGLAAAEATFSVLGLGLFGFLSMLGIGFYNWDQYAKNKKNKEIPGGDMGGFTILFGGSIFPLIELFRKTPSIESRFNASKGPLEKDLQEISQSILTNFEQLNKEVTGKIKDYEDSLDGYRNLKMKLPGCEKQYETLIQQYSTARTELQKMNDYFRNLN